MGRLARPDTNRSQRKYQIQELQTTHREVLRRLLLGQKAVDIASDMNLSPVMVSYTKNSQMGQSRLAELEAARDIDAVDVAKDIRAHLQEMIDHAYSIVRDPNQPAAARLNGIFGLCDRGGLPPLKRVETTKETYTMSIEVREELKRRAARANIIDVKPSQPQLEAESG